MKIDISTIALIIVISNIMLAILIFFQSYINKKYRGIIFFAIGSTLYAIGFLLILMQEIISITFLTVVFGNSLLLLAIIFQYYGLMRFLEIKVHSNTINLLFVIVFFALFYFEYFDNNITFRVLIINLSIAIVSFLISLSILGNMFCNIKTSIYLLSGLYLINGGFLTLRAIISVFLAPINQALSPEFLQIILFSEIFVVSLLTTFGVVFLINKRVSAEISEVKDHFELIFNLSPDVTLITRFDDGLIVNYNNRFLELSGYSREEVMGKSINELNVYEKDTGRQDMLTRLNENGFCKNIDTKFRCKDGHNILCIVSAEKINLNNSLHIISIIRDITDRKKAEDALKSSEEKYRLLTEFASDVIWVLNLTNQKFTYMSPSILLLRGFTVEESMNESLEESMTSESFVIVNDAITRNMDEFIANPKDCTDFIIQAKQPCKNGDIIWIEISAKFRYNTDRDIEIVGVSRNIEKRKLIENQILYLSYHDEMTGLYNRRFYEEELKRLDNVKNYPLVLIMADINGLKLNNDAFGHQTGDLLIKKISSILKKECQEDEIVARIGGDEFVILLPRTVEEKAKNLIEHLEIAINNEKIDNVILSMSFGYSLKQNSSEDINEVFKKAEEDMYKHKLSESSYIKSKTIDIIINLLYQKNNCEKINSKRVSEICEAIANTLNFETSNVNELKTAGLMHDIGKIGIRETIFNKSEKLCDEEWDEIKRHPEIGYRILSSSNEFSKIAEYILEHHERWDGNGYPRGLKGEELCVEARIIAIADSYVAMTSEKNYRNILSKEEALNEISRCSGTQFDPQLATLFLEKMRTSNLGINEL